MVTLVLAEKSKQAAAYADALGTMFKREGVYVVPNSPFFPDEVHIVAPEGHLFSYDPPKDEWELEKLPLVDISFKQSLKKDKKSKEAFKRIYQEVMQADQIIIGTDSDREGERIAYSILSHILGGKEKIRYRLWVNSMTTRALQRAFQNLKTPAETYNYYLEAEARAQSDWLIGFNLSRLVTIELRTMGHISRKKSLSVGRVQTPAVRLICENDVAIQSFVPQTYLKLQAEDKNFGVTFSNRNKFLDKEEVFPLLRNMAETSTVSSVEFEEVSRPAEPLYNISDFQAYAAKRWKFDSDKTEDLLESLYTKKYISYPRADPRYITEEEFNYLKRYLKSYQEVINCHFEPAYLEPRELYVNEEKLAKESHYAIVPTEDIPVLASLTVEERLVYEEIVRRTILMFAADCRYQTMTVQLENQGLEFKTTGRRVLDKGWTEWSDQKLRADVDLPLYQVGDSVQTRFNIIEGVTKPPKRITESQLIGQIFPKYGLGTPATRGEIIKAIKERGYVRKDRKTGQLFPTNIAYLLIHYMYENEFSDPETTGGWEMFLAQIGEGTINPREFVDGIKEKIAAQINQVKERRY